MSSVIKTTDFIKMQTEKATLQEIEKLLLGNDHKFDPERRKFIFCNDKSVDLVAAAGSGKTTLLVAKLLFLEKKFPLENNKGICVLTHTNVAINMIKEKIGTRTSLFSYPNFFGTIQQFTDKFLCIPAYKQVFGRSPRIDSEIHDAILKKLFFENGLNKNGWIYNHVAKRIKSGSSWQEQNSIKFDFLKSLKLVFDKKKVFSFKRNFADDKLILDGSKKSKTYCEIWKIKEEVIKNSGFITYDDAYSFAFWYLDQCPFVADVISERFQYVFIDEMQDTASHQLIIINKIFPIDKTKIQKIGDINQAIYNSENNHTAWVPQENFLPLTGSLRFSQTISESIKGLRIDLSQDLSGNNDVPNIPPYIILYKEGEETGVITKFKQILEINEDKLDLKEDDKIKVIGWNGKSIKEGGNSHSIHKYFPNYTKAAQINKRYFHNLKTYLELSKKDFFRTYNLKTYRDLVLDIFARFLSEQGLKVDKEYPTGYRVFNFLKKESNFSDKLFYFSIKLSLKADTKGEIQEYLRNEFVKFWETEENKIILKQNAENFLTTEDVQDFAKPEMENNSNVFDKFGNIPIRISTIHGVKGETHKATLYLETYYKEFDLEKILPFLLEESRELISKPEEKYRLKIAYVGMSRASHLLCLAMRESVLDSNLKEKLEKKGWIICPC